MASGQPAPGGPIPRAPKTAGCDYAVFSSAQGLLEALSAILHRSESYPESVIVIGAGPRAELAVSVDPRAVRGLERLRNQVNWKFRWLTREQIAAMGKQLSRRSYMEILQPTFTPLNTEEAALRGWGETEFLLGAENMQQARKLLTILANDLQRGLQAWPKLQPFEDHQEGERKERPGWLWVVRGKLPPRTAFQAASRVWYGPVARTLQDNRVYVQWPQRISLSIACLERLQWGSSGGLVLLGQDAPQVLLVRDPPGWRRPEYVHVGEVSLKNREKPIVLQPAAVEDTPAFNLTLRLVEDASRSPLVDQRNQIEDEITRQETRLQRLRGQVQELDEWLNRPRPTLPPPAEPFYVYFSEPGKIPEVLKRLLVERDEVHELPRLYYQRIQAKDWPREAGWPHRDAHLLTTEAARSGLGEATAFPWLRDYRPEAHQGLAFRLLPDWVEHQLKLFLLDTDQRLEFYPPMPVGEMAARRLRDTLLGGRDPGVYAALITREESGLKAWTVDLQSFSPVLGAFPWKCAIQVTDLEGDPVRQEAAQQSMVEKIAETFQAGAVEAVNRSLKQTEEEAAAIVERLQQANQRQASLGTNVGELEAAVGELQRELDGLSQALRKAPNDAQEWLRRIRDLADQARKLTRK